MMPVPAAAASRWVRALPAARLRTLPGKYPPLVVIVERGELRVRLEGRQADDVGNLDAARLLVDRLDAGEPPFVDERPLPPLDLEPAAWALPPSQRVSPDPPMSSERFPVLETEPEPGAVSLRGTVSARLDAATLLGLVVLGDGGVGGLVCLAAPERVECTRSELTSLESASPTTGGWLVTGRGTGSGGRGGTRVVGVLGSSDDGLMHQTLGLGGSSGMGEACSDHEGYCVWLSGVAHAARMLTPSCLERRPGASWSATHVRVGDEWLDEMIRDAPDCVTTFRVHVGRFVDEPCGPEAAARRCADDDLALPRH